MPRPRSRHVAVVKQKLAARLSDGLHRPGHRFMSNRAIAEQFGVSYQTAHRLACELAAEGLLERRPFAGTFVAGRRRGFRGVHLIFNARAGRRGSFGHRLATMLKAGFAAAGLPVRTSWVEMISGAGSVPGMIPGMVPGAGVELSDAQYPIMWEVPEMVEEVGQWGGYGLLLNDRVPRGLSSLRIDTITIDDFLGGVLAAEIIAARVDDKARCVVFAGPRDDGRSQARVCGFRERRAARVVHAPTWYLDDAATAAAARCVKQRPAAIFACNDRLAQAVMIQCEASGVQRPLLIGFDDAPIAESLHLSSIAIPWKAMVEAAVKIARQRVAGDATTAADVILRPHPVIRLTT
ncbi:MAG: substrate-binding domain-containing protein [Phycisphaerales bacterium]